MVTPFFATPEANAVYLAGRTRGLQDPRPPCWQSLSAVASVDDSPKDTNDAKPS